MGGSLDENLAYTHTRNLAAADVRYVLETSVDLENWVDATGWNKVSEKVIEGTFSKVTWIPESAADREFVRVRASQR